MAHDARRIPSRVLAASTLALATFPSLGAQKQPTFPAGIDLVKVDVVVVDKDGKPVRGLTRADFRVFDEGRERPVASFEAVVAPPPLSGDAIRVRPPRVSSNLGVPSRPPKPLLIFVFDSDRLSVGGAARSVTALREFVGAHATLDADAVLASTRSDGTWSGDVRDLRVPAVLDRALSTALGPAGSGWNRLGAARWRRFVELIERFAAGRSRRTTMIVLAEGGATGKLTRSEIASAAARHRVVIYGADARGLQAPGLGVDQPRMPGTAESTKTSFVFDDADSWAAELALATGGRNVRNTAHLDVALGSFVEESLNYYLLGFEPDAGAQPGKLRSIHVRLVDRDYEVRARPAYLVPKPGKRLSADAPAGVPLPLRAAAFVLGPVSDGKASVRLVMEVDPASLDPGGRVNLESQVDVVPLGGGQARKIEHRSDVKLTPELRRSLSEAWVPLVRDVDLSPGRYEARLVLRDVGTGRAGALTHVFDVPATDALRLTTPVITDLFRPDGSGREIARVRFDPAREVECAFEVLGFATAEDGRPRLAARYSLRSPAGEEVAARDIQAGAANPTRFIFPLPLTGLAHGSYTLSLTMRDLVSGSAVESEEPIELGAAPFASS